MSKNKGFVGAAVAAAMFGMGCQAALADDSAAPRAYMFGSAGAAHVEIPDFGYGTATLAHGKLNDIEGYGYTINGGFGIRFPAGATLPFIGAARSEFGVRYLEAKIKSSVGPFVPTGGTYVGVNGLANTFAFALAGTGDIEVNLEEFELSKTLFLDDWALVNGDAAGGLQVTPFVRSTAAIANRQTVADLYDFLSAFVPFHNFVNEDISSYRVGLGAGLDAKLQLLDGGPHVELRASGGLTYVSADANMNDCAAFDALVPCDGVLYRTSAADTLNELSYHARAEGRFVLPIIAGVSLGVGGWVEALERPQVKYPTFVGDRPAHLRLKGVYQAGVTGNISVELP